MVYGNGERLQDDIGILENNGETGPEETDFITLLYKPHQITVMNIVIPMDTEDESGFKARTVLKARCITYNPFNETLLDLQVSVDPVVIKHIPNSKVPIRRISKSQLLTAAILSCEEIVFKNFAPNETKFGLTYMSNVSKRFK